MKIFFNLLLLAACGILASGEPNAIVNGDFKLGPAGFGVWRLETGASGGQSEV